MLETPQRVKDRLLSRIEVQNSGCWVTNYSVMNAGYAQIGWSAEGRTHMRLVHRVSWEIHKGAIPDGMTVDHVCFNRLCVNPAHLRLLSNYENSRRHMGRDWPIGECPAGHPDSIRVPNPSRNKSKTLCPKCKAEATRRWQQSKKQAKKAAA